MFRASGSATVSLCQARGARHQETGCKSTRANSRDLGVKVSGFTMQFSCRVQGQDCSRAVGCIGRVVGSQGCWVSGFRSTPAPSSVLGERERRREGRDRNNGEGGQIPGSPSLTGPFLLLGGSRRSGREPIFLGVSTSSHGILNLFNFFLRVERVLCLFLRDR